MVEMFLMLICTIVLVEPLIKTFVLLCATICFTSSPLYRCTILPLLKSPLGDLGADGLGCFFLVPRHSKARSHPSNRFTLSEVPKVCPCSGLPFRKFRKPVLAPVWTCESYRKAFPLRFTPLGTEQRKYRHGKTQSHPENLPPEKIQ